MTTLNSESILEPVPDLEIYVRLAEALEKIGIPQSRLAKEAGISEGAVSRGVRHKEGLETHWRKIAKVLIPYGVNDRWLLFGTGEMRDVQPDTKTPEVAFPALTAPELAEGVKDVGTVTENAGFAEPVTPKIKSCQAESAVLVQDGSMDPLIRPGQWAMLAPATRIPKDGDVVLLRTNDGSAFVRRYRSAGENIVLEHINQDRRYRTVVIPRSEVSSTLVVVGVIFE